VGTVRGLPGEQPQVCGQHQDLPHMARPGVEMVAGHPWYISPTATTGVSTQLCIDVRVPGSGQEGSTCRLSAVVSDWGRHQAF
jgi:hypothetical protein